MAVYQINKGIGRSPEFKGLRSQYLFIFAGGLLAILIAFMVLYMAGVNQWICIALGVISASVLVWATFHLNAKYGEWGLMKMQAAKNHPRYIINRKRFLRLTIPNLESTVQHVSAPVFPKSITYMVATITLLAFMAFGLYVYNSFIAEPRIEVVGVSNEPQQTIVPTSTQVEPNISNDQTVNVDSLESTQSATQEQ